MGKCDKSGFGADRIFDLFRIDEALRISINFCERDFACEFHDTQGSANAVVFKIGGDNMVALI